MDLKYFYKPGLIRRISSLNYRNMKRYFSQPNHAHASYGHEIIYLDYGSMNILLDGRNLLLKSGEILIIKGGTNHSFTGSDGISFDYLNIMFRGNLPDHLFNRPIPINRKMRSILLQVKHEMEFQEENFCEMTGSLLTELAVYLIRSDKETKQTESTLFSNSLHYEEDKIDKAIEFIRSRYNTTLKVEDVAEFVQVSASHLRLLLRKCTGKNFTTLLHEFRIEAAKHLIADESYNFSEIALKVGFSSSTFFFKLFKRHTGMTPKEYAKKLK